MFLKGNVVNGRTLRNEKNMWKLKENVITQQ